MARGYPGAFGRAANALWIWLRLVRAVRAAVPARPPLAAAAPRPRCAARVLGLVRVLRRRRSASRCRRVVPAARLPARAHAGASRARPRREAAACCVRTWLPRCVAIVFLLGIPRRAQRRRLQRHRRRLRERDRRRPHGSRRAAVRRVPARRRIAATRTARSPTPLTCRSRRCWPWRGTLGRPAGRTRRGRRRSISAARCCCGCSAAGSRGRELGLLLAYLWVTYPFTLLVANSGANDALVALLVLAALLVAGAAGGARRAGGAAGLTKFAPLALAPLFATYRSSGDGVGVGGHDAGGVRGRDRASCSRRWTSDAVLGPHARLPGRTATRRSRSGACYDLRRSAGAPSQARGGAPRRGRRVRAAAARPSDAGRAGRRRADRAPAARGPLVLPLPRLVRCRSCWVALLTPAQDAGSARSSRRAAAASPG